MSSELNKIVDEYKNLNLQEVIDYEKFCVISIIWHSTKIEGCSLTETDTQVLLDKDITANGKPLSDHLMIKDHYNAFQFIKEQAKVKRKLSIDFIKEIGALVMKNTGSQINTAIGSYNTSNGDLRLSQVYVEKKYFPDYSKIDQLLQNLCNIINEKLDKVTKNEIINLSSDMHYNFVNIHPFGDGNGRTARLLMNYIQQYHNEPLIKIFSEDRVVYINALNETEEKDNIEIFRSFIKEQQIKFLKSEIEKYKDLSKDYKVIT